MTVATFGDGQVDREKNYLEAQRSEHSSPMRKPSTWIGPRQRDRTIELQVATRMWRPPAPDWTSIPTWPRQRTWGPKRSGTRESRQSRLPGGTIWTGWGSDQKPMILSPNRQPGTRTRAKFKGAIFGLLFFAQSSAYLLLKVFLSEDRLATASGGRRLLPESSIYP